jgi:hypothetical protein
VTELALTGWALVAVVVMLVALWVAWVAAARLDRLHRRVRDARTTLDAQLVRRAAAAWDLAISGYLDPASSIVVATAARDALDHIPGADAALEPRAGVVEAPRAARRSTLEDPPVLEEIDQAMAESELSRVLRAALGGPEDRAALAADAGAAELLDRLDREWYRVQLARRFHNDAVVAVRRIRAKGYVRLFRLAGRAPNPQTFELDDSTGLP